MDMKAYQNAKRNDPAVYGGYFPVANKNSEYPKRYELLDKNGMVLGIGVRWRKYQRIKWSLPFVEASRWIAGGRRTELIKDHKEK